MANQNTYRVAIAGCLGGAALAACLLCPATMSPTTFGAGTARAEDAAQAAETPPEVWEDAWAEEVAQAPEAESGSEPPAPEEDGEPWGEAAGAEPALRVVSLESNEAVLAPLVLTAEDGMQIDVCVDEGGVLDPSCLSDLPGGLYLIGARGGWTLAGALANAGTQSERPVETADGQLAVELPLADGTDLTLLVVVAPEAEGAGTNPDEEPAEGVEAGDDSPTGPDMSGAEATGVPMANGWSSDPLEYLLQVVSQRRETGSAVFVIWSDPQSGCVEYARG